MTIHPKNWKSDKAPIKKDWHIGYRFYAADGEVKQILIRSMNKFKDREERRQATELLFTTENDRLELKGYNPITEICTPPVHEAGDLSAVTPFIHAIDEAYARLECGKSTKNDIRIAIVHIKTAIEALSFDGIPVEKIKIRNIMMILERIGKEKGGWSPTNFNHYRSYLLMLFKIIVPMANMTGNPVRDIPVRKKIKRQRLTLTRAERAEVKNYLRANHYAFWRFTEIFFHSGIRETEMMRITKRDVDLENERVKVLVLKGDSYEEVFIEIKTIALPLWKEVMRAAEAITMRGDVYLFSVGLVPGSVRISATQINRRWKRLVKDPLGIEADFYSLKHSHTTEVRKILSAVMPVQEAVTKISKFNNHKSTKMEEGVYDIDYLQAKNQEVKAVNNAF